MRRTLLVLFFLMPLAHAGDGYFAYARVIDAEPITKTQRIPLRKEVCSAASKVAPPGDARREQPQATIGDLIRADDRLRRPQCRTVTSYESQQKTVGWRVTYSYAGEVYVRRMQNKPGERIRVRVDIDAG